MDIIPSGRQDKSYKIINNSTIIMRSTTANKEEEDTLEVFYAMGLLKFIKQSVLPK